MAKLGMSTYSVRKALAANRLKFDGSLFGFASDAGVSGLELCASQLEAADLDEEAPLRRLIAEANDHGLEVFAFCVESGLLGVQAPAHAPFDQWKEAARRSNLGRADYCRDWMDLAEATGVEMIRFCYGAGFYGYQVTASQVVEFNLEMATELYGTLCAEAKDRGLELGFENHGFITSDLVFAEQLLGAVPDLKVCLDLGNLPSDRMPYVEMVARSGRTLYVHAKSHEFDDDGNEVSVDYPAVVALFDEVGFDGWFSVEWEGSGKSDEEGVRTTLDLLRRCGVGV
ncbi:MAG: hypothetical protein Kow0069_15190 [Promethearchaeota archaeon]